MPDGADERARKDYAILSRECRVGGQCDPYWADYVKTDEAGERQWALRCRKCADPIDLRHESDGG
jgi:hypothetical protein